MAQGHKRAFARLDELERRLGYVFRDRELLFEALTHRSALMEFSAEQDPDLADLPWNERLEFLGDAVLGLSVAARLMVRAEQFSEGELSRLRASLVNEESLARVAKVVDLGTCLAMGRGAAQGGGRERASILADAMEAVIGAVFSDAGFAAADALVERLFAEVFPELSNASEAELSALRSPDYKTMLQELMQEAMKITPTYDMVSSSGPDHEKRFEVRVMVGERELGRGGGASKKRASQEAARVALARLTLEPPPQESAP